MLHECSMQTAGQWGGDTGVRENFVLSAKVCCEPKGHTLCSQSSSVGIVASTSQVRKARLPQAQTRVYVAPTSCPLLPPSLSLPPCPAVPPQWPVAFSLHRLCHLDMAEPLGHPPALCSHASQTKQLPNLSLGSVDDPWSPLC